MPERWFITGTGTAIGKTLVTAALACQFRAQGRSVTALKPVLSGFEREAAAGSDSGILLAACGLQLSDASLDAITPWRFREPLSPDMAAAREGRALELGAIVDFCRAAAEDEPDVCLVEGVGGSMVPLDAESTVRLRGRRHRARQRERRRCVGRRRGLHRGHVRPRAAHTRLGVRARSGDRGKSRRRAAARGLGIGRWARRVRFGRAPPGCRRRGGRAARLDPCSLAHQGRGCQRSPLRNDPKPRTGQRSCRRSTASWECGD